MATTEVFARNRRILFKLMHEKADGFTASELERDLRERLDNGFDRVDPRYPLRDLLDELVSRRILRQEGGRFYLEEVGVA